MNWYAWGPEAFEAARRLDRPIFLSIGYSTCYWCHVMERESFENADIAAQLNDGFIAIKVDREERPDIDDLYMTAVQLMSGHGGWPMSVFLEPHTLKPFYAGTYFPPIDAYGRPGFPTLLARVQDAWRTRRREIESHAKTVADAIAQHVHGDEHKLVPLDGSHVHACIDQLMFTYDPVHGGFGSGSRAPKFPTPGNMLFLLEAARDQSTVHDAVGHTLTQMSLGGIHDHLAGGFHRYSVDERWLVPHFEKMLYDQALIVMALCAYLRVQNDHWLRDVLRTTITFVLRDMRDANGMFVSAIDAETNAREGLTYIWSRDEIRSTLRAAGLENETDFALALFGMEGQPNFSDPHHPEAPPAWVLHRPLKPDDAALRMEIDPSVFEQRSQRVRETLLRARAQRDQPTTDHKIIAGWNGLMIAACAQASAVLGDDEPLHAARQAMDAVLQHCAGTRSPLLRIPSTNGIEAPAPLEDHAFIIHGLIELSKATGESRWADKARQTCSNAIAGFWSEQAGYFHDTSQEQTDLFLRLRSVDDGAVPSGTSMMALNLIDLAWTMPNGDTAYAVMVDHVINSLSHVIADQPMRCVLGVLALHRVLEHHGASSSAPTITAEDAHLDDQHSIVPVQATVEKVRIADGTTANFDIVLTIAEPYIIHSHDAPPHTGVPLNVQTRPDSGWNLSAQYPNPTALDTEGAGIHRGHVTIHCTAHRKANATPTIPLLVTCQPCTHESCLREVNLPLTLHVPN